MLSILSPTVVLHPNDTVQAAIDQLEQAQTSYAGVVDKQRLVGVFTERDLIRTIAQRLPLEHTTLQEVMSPPPVGISEAEIAAADGTTLWQRFQPMLQAAAVFLPVHNFQGAFVGVIALGDAISAIPPFNGIETSETEQIETSRAHPIQAGTIQADTIQIAHPVELLPLLAPSSRVAIREALQRADLANQLLWDVFPNLLIRMRQDGTYLDFIPAKAFKSYVPAPEVCGRTLFEVMPPDFAQQRMHYIQLALQTGKTRTYEFEVEIDGDRRYQEAQITASAADEVLIVVRDVTERNRLELALRSSESKLRDILNSAIPSIVSIRFYSDHTWKYNYYSAGCELVFGFTPNEMMEGVWWSRIPEEDQITVITPLFDEILAGRSMQVEYRFLHKDGTLRWIFSSASAYYEETQGCWIVTAVDIDVTHRKQVEAALLNSEERFREIAETVSQVFDIRCAKTGEFLYVNPAYEETWGLTCKSLYADQNSWLEVIHPDDRPYLTQTLKHQFAGHSTTREYRIIRSDGSIRWIRANISPIRDETGELLRFIGISEDITNRKQIEQELAESQRFIQSIADASPNILYLCDAVEQKTVYVNRRVEHLLGYTPEEIIAMGSDYFRNLVHPDDLEICAQNHQQLFNLSNDEIQGYEYRMRHRNGEWRWFRSLETVFEWTADGTPKLILGTAIDINEQKQAAAEVERSEKKYRDLVQIAGSIILRHDSTGKITFINEYGQQFFGYTEEELLNRNIIGTLVPEFESTGRNLRTLIENLCRDPRMYELSENENILKTGERVWVRWSDQPIYNDRGEVVEILSVGVDITDRKRAEQALSLAKEAAEAASRAKSEFLSLMSHELRTPLTSILGFAEVIARDAALSAEHQDYLDIIRESGTHLLHLINSVLEMSKIEAGELVLTPKPFDLHRLLDNLYALFHLKASSKGLTLRLQQADLPRYLCADAEKLHQVVSNLLENAIKFTNTGSVVLRFNIQHIEEGIRLLQIEVEDTGVGIAPEEISSLFEPFVQTSSGRKLQQGTGLGLAISQRFVRLMGGTIAVQSQVDHGSIFTVAIPVVLPPIPDSSPHSMTDWATADWATADWATPHQMESVSTQPYPSDLSKDELSLIGLNSTEFPQANSSPSIATLEDPVTMIEELSVEWLADLHFAALRLSSDQCLHLIQQLPTTQAELANRLNDWVDRFQFEAIIEWAEALHSSDNPKSI